MKKAQNLCSIETSRRAFLGTRVSELRVTFMFLQPDSEVESMKKQEEKFFTELCSTVLKTGVEGQRRLVN